MINKKHVAPVFIGGFFNLCTFNTNGNGTECCTVYLRISLMTS